eukprot:TRINITY_DN3451_c0_g1_i2.p1 TRINITY_DN3451_c0_g1~~TRINITY_DN3451_c0_g1_i2.p1  ORF type:complete len:235 (-),score=27.32 TRINITY_DN3451_c0_g1_i2:407-1111(-)
MVNCHNILIPKRSPSFPVSKKSVLFTSLRKKCSAEGAVATTTPTLQNVQESLSSLIKNTNRGIFGTQLETKKEILELVQQLEDNNPLKQPAKDLHKLNGKWILLWSTIAIQGAKRTKLGLREFVQIGQMAQIIDNERSLATNEVEFNLAGMAAFSGCFTIVAEYKVVSDQRVEIKFVESTLEPSTLQEIFEQNYDLLLSIFNPEGWLDITYVDDYWRIGRDDKQNVFILTRAPN